MTIKEFLAAGNSVKAQWEFTELDSKEAVSSNSAEDYSTVEDIVTVAIEHGSFDEFFDLYDKNGHKIATNLDEAEANSFIANL
ncbi:hypothetical protein [Lactobacillus crispatus]|uniref:hypothetical protein n=1 Tax=Lactobacillus crispatus TaxID=47770 RepID=UPI00105C6B1B|nr:hypothetical protein [Lactobacillus crispatus]TDN09346.1 hypothetical protein CEE83_11845 [Lactobacillus crispatus]